MLDWRRMPKYARLRVPWVQVAAFVSPRVCSTGAAKRLRPALQLRTRLPATGGNGTCVQMVEPTNGSSMLLVSLLRVRVNKSRLVSLGSWLRGDRHPATRVVLSCV